MERTYTEFSAPFGARVFFLSATAVALSLTTCGAGAYLYFGLKWRPVYPALLSAMPLIVTVISFIAFHIRSYAIVGNELLIRRFLRTERIQLRDIISAAIDPLALKDAFLFPAFGLFSLGGDFRTKRLGLCRVHATDPARAVVLAFTTYKIIVTPDNPKTFIATIKRNRDGLRSFSPFVLRHAVPAHYRSS